MTPSMKHAAGGRSGDGQGGGSTKRALFTVAGVCAAACMAMATFGSAIVSAASPRSGHGRAAKACVPRHRFSTINRGTLSISTVPILPYFDYNVDKKQMEGVEAGALRQIAKWECLKTSVQVLSGAAGLQAVVSKKDDVSAGGWYKTSQRAKVVGLTVPLYYDFTVLVSRTGVSKLSSLKGKPVGVVAGSLFVQAAQNVVGASNVHQYQLADAAFSDLETGRVDAVIFGSAEAGYLIKQKKATGLKVSRMTPEKDFPPSESAGTVVFPYTKSNPALGRALNADIKTLRSDGKMKQYLRAYGLTNPQNFQLKGA